MYRATELSLVRVIVDLEYDFIRLNDENDLSGLHEDVGIVIIN